MKSWRVKFRNFLGDFPVHYEALFINRTVNNNYLTLLMALHHIHDGFWYLFLDAKRAVSNYYSYKEKTIKLLPYHSFYEGHIPLRKIEPPFLAANLKKKNTKPPWSPFTSISLKNCKLHLSWSLQHSALNICGHYYFFSEYKLVTC